jgi:signal transduction histidine kinase
LDIDGVLLPTLLPESNRAESRLWALMKANNAITQELDLATVLRRIVEVAVELVGAEFGALGVISPHGGLEEFIHVGMIPADVLATGHLPEGHGLLGALIEDPRPIRLDHLESDPRSAGFPVGHPAMDSFVGVPVRVRDAVYGNLYLTNQKAGRFSAEDQELITALATTAGFAIENARLFAETRRRTAWSSASAEITAAMLATESSDAITLLAIRVLELADADFVRVALPTDDRDTLIVGTACGLDSEAILGRRFARTGSLCGSVLEARQPRLINEGETPRVMLGVRELGGPTMAIPLLASGRELGVLAVSRLPGRSRFTSADLEMAADLAGQASVAMELASARVGQQRMLLLEDRGRIARDLHDHVIQQLFATGLELQTIAGALGPGRAAERIESSVGNLDTAILQIRTVIFSLSGARDGAAGEVRHRIIEVVNDLSAGLIQTPQVVFTGPVDLVITGGLADDVVAVVREALSNVVRHADARHVSVSVAVDNAKIEILVIDDGVGPRGDTRRSGLTNLAERAEGYGGSFALGAVGGLTNAHWSVPLAAANDLARHDVGVVSRDVFSRDGDA